MSRQAWAPRLLDGVPVAPGEELGPFGIGRGEFDVLATLRRAGEPYSLSPTALAESLMLTTGGMTGRLERAGLSARSANPGDCRALRASHTGKGRKLVDEALADQVRALLAELE